MKKLILISQILFAIPCFAVANFTGHWVGPGKVSSTVGLTSNCTQIDIVIEQSINAFVIKSYKSSCGLYSSDWGPNTMQINGDQIFEDGEQIGHLNEDTLISIMPDTSVDYAFNLKLTTDSNGKPAVQSYYGVKNGIGSIVIEGTLTKIQ